MGFLRMITGGARSGKSNYAEAIAKSTNAEVCYIATAIAFDDGMKDRIKKHRESRPQEWKTIERYKNFSEMKKKSAFQNAEVLLFDCLTVMITNNMLEESVDYDHCSMDKINEIEAQIKKQVMELLEVCKDKDLIIVSNEVGLGLVPSYPLGGYFRDIAGRMNQLVAAKADEVYFTVAGIPMKIK